MHTVNVNLSIKEMQILADIPGETAADKIHAAIQNIALAEETTDLILQRVQRKIESRMEQIVKAAVAEQREQREQEIKKMSARLQQIQN